MQATYLPARSRSTAAAPAFRLLEPPETSFEVMEQSGRAPSYNPPIFHPVAVITYKTAHQLRHPATTTSAAMAPSGERLAPISSTRVHNTTLSARQAPAPFESWVFPVPVTPILT